MKFRAPKTTIAIAVVMTLTLLSCGSNRITFSKDRYQRSKSNDLKENLSYTEKEHKLEVPEVRPELVQVFTNVQASKTNENVDPIKKAVEFVDLRKEKVVNKPRIEKSLLQRNGDWQSGSNLHLEQTVKAMEGNHREIIREANGLSSTEKAYFIIAILLPFFAIASISEWDWVTILVSIGVMVSMWLPAFFYSVL
ncbi:MAG: hypothetical protein N4A41_00930 [Crocinitomicaceae bacterium]|jgi:hypothetical protein|nr:hypothetical protein [Crocinitomicaceae bacterium]